VICPWLLFGVWLNLSSGEVSAHGLHLSIGKAELGATAFTGKMVFNRDDFVEALDRWNNEIQVHDLTPEALERLTLRYMKRHFKVEANGTSDLKLEITKAGEGKDTIWMRFRFGSSDSIKQIKVEHRVLFGAFPDQGNVLEVKTEAGKESHLFKIDSPIVVFKF
jgi:hypothetical protein